MNEPLNETVVPEEIGTPEPVSSGDAEWDAALAEAGEPSPEPTPDAAPEPTPETPEPTPVAEDFTHTVLQNGEHEIRLSNGETYRGKSELEVAQKIAASKVEANKYIQQLKTPKQTETPAPTPAAIPQIDPTSKAIADMTAQGLGFKDASEMQAMIAEFRGTTQNFQQVTQEQQQMAAAQQFISSTPDFMPTPTNIAAIETAFEIVSRGAGLPPGQFIPVTPESYKLAHDTAKSRGLYEAPKLTPPAAPNRAMPLPPSGNAPSPRTGKAEPTLADLEAMTPEQLEELMDGMAA